MQNQTRKLLLNLATGVAIAATAAVVILPGTAFAAPGTITSNVNVRSGPGTSFGVVDTLRSGTRVDVGQCQGSFCYITDVDGWVSASFINRGGSGNVQIQAPSIGVQIGPGGVQLGLGIGGGVVDDDIDEDDFEIAEVCFYERTRFRGESLCLEEGESSANLRGFADRISSIENPDGLEVTVCARTNFRDCRTYTTSANSVGRLDDDISSAEVE